jgi:peptide/nickel transport system substrate-binding protein
LPSTRSRHRNTFRLSILAVSLALVATSCLFGGSKGGSESSVSGATALGIHPTESGLPAKATPRRGGQLVYGLEAEVDKGYCLPESQLAISGMQVVHAIYDTLTVPDAKGGYAPYLAKGVDHDADYKTWTITLRPGITFHDGTPLDAQVVKDNLDAYRGSYPGRSPLLFTFVFNNVATVSVINQLTVQVTTKVPWVAFPAALYSSGRLGIAARAQLDASLQDCSSKPIGTGPFSFVSWNKNVALKLKRNPHYWQTAPDGEPYPYLDAVEFRPMPNSDERVAALAQGEINMMHTSTASDMTTNLAKLRDEGAINLMISNERTEVAYLMLNATKPPFNTTRGRLAVAQAIDRRTLNEKANAGFATIADGPFAPDVMGHLDDTGFPGYDPVAAKAAVKAMKADGENTSVHLLSSSPPVNVRLSELEKEMLEAAGFTVTLDLTNESDLIQRAIGGNFEMAGFRNQPGEDPDMDHIWWYGGGNPVNFGRFDDPIIDAALDRGRSSASDSVRRTAYEGVNRQFAKQIYNVWLWYAPWAVAEAANVHGIIGPPLPGNDAPSSSLVTGHSLLGIWIDRPDR